MGIQSLQSKNKEVAMSDNTNEFTDRQTGTTFNSARQLVDTYIERFSQKVSRALGSEIRFPLLDADGFSSIARGSATVGINVLEDQGTLVLLSPIMDVPHDHREGFYRRLLELNFAGSGDAAFAIDRESNKVFLRAARMLDGLDYDEFEGLLDSVATVADEWDDQLRAEFS